tara:strand:+ start:4740 stop:5984 length:1245 start_codon:yes stop_codon:yes gene_type:complete
MGASTSGGLPIRLVQRNGDLIHLHCTDYSFSVQRAVAAIPVPALAERIGADMNLVTIDMSLNCLLIDDDCAGTSKSPRAAGASIDFSTVAIFEATGDEDATDAFMDDDGGTVTCAQLNGKTFSVRTTHQVSNSLDPITVKFDTSIAPAASNAGTTILTVGLNGVADTGAALATALRTAFTAHVGTFAPAVTAAGGNTFSSAFTVSATTTGKNTGFGNCALSFTQIEAGINGNSGTPSFWTDDDNERTSMPSHQVMSGGASSHSCKSAGDKMQDLIASVANTNVGGAIGGAFNLGGKTDKGGFDLDLQLDLRGSGDDYIVGIQIPYNSLLHADVGTDLLPSGYGTRNFLIVTGITSPDSQNAAGNVNPASTTFDSRDMMTGIRGTVAAANFKYEAGATTYGAEITFNPIDMIVGL